MICQNKAHERLSLGMFGPNLLISFSQISRGLADGPNTDIFFYLEGRALSITHHAQVKFGWSKPDPAFPGIMNLFDGDSVFFLLSNDRKISIKFFVMENVFGGGKMLVVIGCYQAAATTTRPAASRASACRGSWKNKNKGELEFDEWEFWYRCNECHVPEA